MRDFSAINRLTGSLRHTRRRLGERVSTEKRMTHLDPYWKERVDTEMVLFDQKAPLGTHMEYPDDVPPKTEEPITEPTLVIDTVSTDRHGTTRKVQRATIQRQ